MNFKTYKIQHKKVHTISIIGLGRSGKAAAMLAASDGFSVTVSDISDNDDTRKQGEELVREGIFVELGEHSEKILESDIIVISPGVPLTINILKKAADKAIPIISEIEFAYRHEQGRVIAVTGSNGKSTTATLIAKILSDAGIKTFLAGNIGNPYSTIAMKTTPESITVLELSSFQLEAMDSFHPYISVLLNLSPDHLDRYKSTDEYYRAKFHIFDNQLHNDFAVLWADQPDVSSLSERIAPQTLWFSSITEVDNGADIRDGYISRGGEAVLPAKELGIPGPHNLSNALAATAATIPLNIDINSLAHTLQEFAGIEHRLERFAENNGILFVNDSKATNPDALRWALASFNRPIVLIAGGYDKGADFGKLRKLFSEKVRTAVFTGATAERMAQQLGETTIFSVVVKDFEKAVQRAVSMAKDGDVVMLSPGCASFDQFKNFEHRGRVFKEIVKSLIAKNKK